LKLLLADDACDPAQAVAVAEEFVRQRVSLVDGHYCSGASLPASRVYHDHGVLMIMPSSTNWRITEQGFGNVFRLNGRDDAQGTFAARYVVDNRLATNVAIVEDETSFGRSIADEFKNRLNARGITELMYEAIGQSDNDFFALITKMKNAGVQLVYFGGYHTKAGLFVRQARQEGLRATIMGNSAMANQEFWDLAGAAGEGTLMPFGPDPKRLPSAAEVIKKFTAVAYDSEGFTLYSYAANQVFAEAARRAGSTELDALLAVLHAATFETVLGPLSFDAKGDRTGFKYDMYRWSNGEYRKICCSSDSGG
jgi:branched-chain amino acid transport system substrate-binding protein